MSVRFKKPKSFNADKAVTLMQFYLGSWEAGHVDPRNSAMLNKEIARLSRATGYNEVYVWNLVEVEARKQGLVRGGSQNRSGGSSFTMRVENTLTGHANFEGTYASEDEANQRATEKAQRARRFVRYVVYTGTPRAPGNPTGMTVAGLL